MIMKNKLGLIICTAFNIFFVAGLCDKSGNCNGRPGDRPVHPESVLRKEIQ